jgi:hypothetical protein
VVVDSHVNHERRMLESEVRNSISDRWVPSSVYESVSNFSTREVTVIAAQDGVVVCGAKASPRGYFLHCSDYAIETCVP